MTNELNLPQDIELPHGFMLLEQGLFEGSPGAAADPIFICSPIWVQCKFADPTGKKWGQIVSVKADDGSVHQIRVARSELFSKPKDVVSRLLDHGLELAPDKNSVNLLIDFLKAARPSDHIVLADHSGWLDHHFSSFIAGKTVIGDLTASTSCNDSGLGAFVAVKGSAEDWRANVGALCSGNPMMLLAASLAFSGPLLRPLGLHGGGLHFRGASSTGKTTLLSLAASIWGSRDQVSQWRATANGLEAIAPAMNDMLLPLDEIAEISPSDLHAAIYMLANGMGKTRMTRDGTIADTHKWRLAIISSGEISVQEKLTEGRLGVRAGHEVRLIDVVADNRRFGAFDKTDGVPDAASFTHLIQANCQKFHGAVGVEFTKALVETIRKGGLPTISSLANNLTRTWMNSLHGVTDGQVERVAHRFAVIAVAGMLGTKWGLTGWNPAEVASAAKEAFVDWFERRYTDKFEDGAEFLKHLGIFLAANQNTFVNLNASCTVRDDALGWFDAQRFYLPPTTWMTIFPGVDATAAAKSLLDIGVLMSDGGTRFTRKSPRSIPGRPRLYTVVAERLTELKT